MTWQRAITAFGPTAHFYECPRWHGGRWWVSDMRGEAVYAFSDRGDLLETREMDRPGGIGWTPDGRLLVVSMDARKLLRFAADGSGVETTFELGHLFGNTEGFLNDLATTRDGHVYIGFDADFHRYGPAADLGKIVHLAPDGEARIAADGIAFPNGLMVTPDGRTLVVAETMKPRLSSYDIGPDGVLGGARVWASLDPKQDRRPPAHPPLSDRPVMLDGCAIDDQDHVWGADVGGSAVLRIAPGGAIVDAVVLPDGMTPFACALGGPDGRTLLVCGAPGQTGDRTLARESRLFVTTVDVPAPEAALAAEVHARPSPLMTEG